MIFQGLAALIQGQICNPVRAGLLRLHLVVWLEFFFKLVVCRQISNLFQVWQELLILGSLAKKHSVKGFALGHGVVLGISEFLRKSWEFGGEFVWPLTGFVVGLDQLEGIDSGFAHVLGFFQVIRKTFGNLWKLPRQHVSGWGFLVKNPSFQLSN